VTTRNNRYLPGVLAISQTLQVVHLPFENTPHPRLPETSTYVFIQVCQCEVDGIVNGVDEVTGVGSALGFLPDHGRNHHQKGGQQQCADDDCGLR